MSRRFRIALIPRDGFFCKDGRGWHTSASGRGHGLEWPWPSTVLGALRTARGREEEGRGQILFSANDWEALAARCALGATLALRRPKDAPWSRAHRVWPAPADAIWVEGETAPRRLDPAPSSVATLGRDDDEAREALWIPRLPEGAGGAGPRGWWPEEALSEWLFREDAATVRREHVVMPPRRVDAHAAIDPRTGTGREGSLFSHDVVETLEGKTEWALGVEFSSDGGDLPGVVTIGSDRRLARIESLPDEVFEPSAELLAAFRDKPRGLRLVAVSPACFLGGWLPDGFERRGREIRGSIGGLERELILRAACVARPIHISGWDMAAGAPKPTSRMVPPGSVYFFEPADGSGIAEGEASALWLAALGQRTAEGFGRFVPGAWNPKRRHG